ncbi:aminotransferase class III-fold pyridoxal phosphate-dependent enzyme [Tardiphaga sp.]|uniref:aminotransferase class III-fold pyridoxal phosphate-dependent enzyme n=1 Tax=Tardiphaga sp. TaxID=1926292 RepID=UPI0026012225|nr:aminotransferase class III-fold pyridoxal phosphate-dependent enzyme [Tardiphaga sp.]
MTPELGPIDRSLRHRASRVVPGGMYGHMRTAGLPEGYPQFFARGEGCHVWDVDGRKYLDFMCSWGPVVLGHRHPVVDAAVRKQMERGDVLNGPSERMVELAERVVGLVTHADWALFSKNGTDATTTCVTLARGATGKRKVLLANGAYHGAVPWCSPYPFGVMSEDRAHLLYFDYNDIASLEAAVAQAGPDLAAIVVSAFKHDYGHHQELPNVAFARRVRELCDTNDAALILDDVRAGFRLTLHGSWDQIGVQPDLSAWSKAIANGYALSAVMGNDRFRDAAAGLYATGSFWCGAVSMAASLATLNVLEAENGPEHMRAMGQRLRDGIGEQVRRYHLGVRQSGPVQMPAILFEDDPDYVRGYRFTQETLKRGVYMHPKHNMFLSVAHTAADIDHALSVTDDAFRIVAGL